jgi:hypothetical protein
MSNKIKRMNIRFRGVLAELPRAQKRKLKRRLSSFAVTLYNALPSRTHAERMKVVSPMISQVLDLALALLPFLDPSAEQLAQEDRARLFAEFAAARAAGRRDDG